MAYTSDTDKLFLSDAQHEQSVPPLSNATLGFSAEFLRVKYRLGPLARGTLTTRLRTCARRSAIREARAKALADRGAPIQLASKPISVRVRSPPGREPEAWIAESGFVVRRVGLEVRPVATAKNGERFR